MIFDNPHEADGPIEPNCCSFHYPTDGSDPWHGGPTKAKLFRDAAGVWTTWLPPTGVACYDDESRLIRPWGYVVHGSYVEAQEFLDDYFVQVAAAPVGPLVKVWDDGVIGPEQLKSMNQYPPLLAEPALVADTPDGGPWIKMPGKQWAPYVPEVKGLKPDVVIVDEALGWHPEILTPAPSTETTGGPVDFDFTAPEEVEAPARRTRDYVISLVLALLLIATIVVAAWLAQRDDPEDDITPGPSAQAEPAPRSEMDPWLADNRETLDRLPELFAPIIDAVANPEEASLLAQCSGLSEALVQIRPQIEPSPDEAVEGSIEAAFDGWSAAAQACIDVDLETMTEQLAAGDAALAEAVDLVDSRYP